MEQQLLFPEEQATQSSGDEVAAHIAEHAQPVEYEDRTSEAARDQGWGQQRRPEVQPNVTPRFEVPGRNRGRVNPYDQSMRRAEAQRGMTAEEITRQQAINKTGAAIARAALKN